ncbi:MAG: T9SS type A sorting domain-containing protein [Bacteroidia bacterium]|nr:T9SS type A sorting domain-containing protein [Bacteroidia bacterium]
MMLKRFLLLQGIYFLSIFILFGQDTIRFQTNIIEIWEYQPHVSIRLLRSSSVDTVSVFIRTVNKTATSPEDYESVSGRITFLPGQTTQTVLINIFQDLVRESNEQFAIVLKEPWNAVIQQQDTAFVSIIDDDLPVVRVANPDIRAIENQVVPDFRIKITPPDLDEPTTLRIRSTDITADENFDYEAIDTVVIVPAGDSIINLPITYLDDSVSETTERFLVSIVSVSPNAILGGPSETTFHIIDEDYVPVVQVLTADTTLFEACNTVKIPMYITRPTGNPIIVSYRTISLTASENVDYIGYYNKIAIFSPQTTQSLLEIPVINDTIVEGTESFIIQLISVSSNATIGAISEVLVNLTDNEVNSSEKDLASVVRVYPNPSNGIVWIHSPLSIDYQIIDAHLKPVLSGHVDSGIVPIETKLSQGVYFIRLLSTKQSVTQKLIIY